MAVDGGGPTTAKRTYAAGAFRFAWQHRWFFLACVVVAFVGGWQTLRLILGPEIAVDRVARADLVQSVVASGHVETPFRVEIGAQITGTVADVLVEQGQHVVRGQPLIAIQSSELEAALVQATSAVTQAEARLRQLVEFTLPTAKESLAQAEATLRNAQATFDRTSELVKGGYATRAALDDARRALDVARAQVSASRLQVHTASPGGSDFAMAQSQLDQARANRDTARSRLDYATVTAPRDGVLIARNVERGTVVQPGRTLLTLAPAGDTQLVLQIDERNLGLIAIGKQAIASADAYPDRRFAAKVAYINPSVDIARASVEVKLIVADPPDYLRQDMTVSVDIEAARRDATLVLPASDIQDLLTEAPWVLGVRDGHAVRIPVRIGLRGSTRVEIVEGLGEGDIVVPSGAGVRTGQRVRPVFR